MKLQLLYEHHYKSAVAIVYDDQANILLGKALNSGDRSGKWCFPAGGIKPGEYPEEAAVRECFEETGLKVKPQQPAFQHGPKPSVGFVVCRLIGGKMKPNEEFSELRWVPHHKILELTNLYPDVAEVLQKPIAKFP